MVEDWELDDYKVGDWIGVQYQEPEKQFHNFPTIIIKINHRNPDSIDDVVEIANPPQGCPNVLKRIYINRIRHVIETRSCNGH